MSVPPIVLATGNPDKAHELSRLLADYEVATAPAGFDPEETGTTLYQNALLKAEALRPDADPEAIVVADDSGLSVHALAGRPGVFSARYAGPDASYADNCRKLIDELDGIEQRGAAFVAVLVALLPGGDSLVSCGTCAGDITPAMRGEGGFGYDPVFQPRGDDRTMAQLTTDQKAEISHRGRAARGLARLLASR